MATCGRLQMLAIFFLFFFFFFLFFKFFIKVAHFSIAGFLVSLLSKRYICLVSKDFVYGYQ